MKILSIIILFLTTTATTASLANEATSYVGQISATRIKFKCSLQNKGRFDSRIGDLTFELKTSELNNIQNLENMNLSQYDRNEDGSINKVNYSTSLLAGALHEPPVKFCPRGACRTVLPPSSNFGPALANLGAPLIFKLSEKLDSNKICAFRSVFPPVSGTEISVRNQLVYRQIMDTPGPNDFTWGWSDWSFNRGASANCETEATCIF